MSLYPAGSTGQLVFRSGCGSGTFLVEAVLLDLLMERMTPTFACEMIAPLVAMKNYLAVFPDRDVCVFVDDEAAVTTLMRGLMSQ